LDYLVAVVRAEQQDTRTAVSSPGSSDTSNAPHAPPMSTTSHKTKVLVGRAIGHSHGYLDCVSEHLAYAFGVNAEPETGGFGRQH
jgi:hypothetical protein